MALRAWTVEGCCPPPSGWDMQVKYKKTARRGLALNVIEC